MVSSDRRQRSGGRGGTTPPPTTGTPSREAHISALRLRIDELDTVLIGLLQQRARLSAEVQRTRVAHDGPPLAPAREDAVRFHFRSGLGARGGEVADAVLSLCRGGPDRSRPAARADGGSER
ncbi:chorismate mutase [Streptomyces sp. NPDC097107]|uniref:chorismate mutase n=1 Tax=Streptomyces sp. NPDC097107 TaxID=3366089 RepID=UPI0037F639D6